MPQQYQTFILSKDLNPMVTAGMTGIIIEVHDEDTFEVEFVKQDGSNYEYEGQFTFTVHSDAFAL
jgi:hypothetical protein